MTSVMEQTYPDWEMIVIDDHSDDETREVARSFDDPRVRFITSPDRIGMSGNFNRAVDEAAGAYIKLLFADDLLRPNCLAEQVAVLDADHGLALTAARRDMVDATGALVSPRRGIPRQLAGRLDGRTALRRIVASGYNPLGEPASVMYRREAMLEAGAFSDKYVGPADLDMWIRILRHGDFFGDVQTLAVFRIHPGSMTTNLLVVSGQEDRALLREVAADPYWEISKLTLWRGLVRCIGNDLYRRVRIPRVNRQSAVGR